MSDARKNPANTINDVVRNEHRTADILEALTKEGWVFAHKDDLPSSKVEQEPYAWAIEVDGTARGLFYEKTEAGFDANIEGGVVCPLYTHPAPSSDELLKAMQAAITKIAMIAEAWGYGAGEPGIEIAGGIVAYLAANPAETETFLVNPSMEQSLAACRPENWCLTWRAQTGEIMDRATLADYLAKHKGASQ